VNQQDYENYLRLFNARDYDGVLDHFTEDAEVEFAGFAFQGRQVVKDFYAFFHDLVDERITLHRFLSDEHTVALEADVRLEAKADLTEDLLEARGLKGLFTLQKGQVLEVPQFIHYHLRDGKFAKALCAVFTPRHTLYS
jgi:ketosteroid isomerase-like protein